MSAPKARPGADGPASGRAGMSGPRPPARYEIRVEGVLGEHWAGWFEGLQVSSEAGETILSGPVTDQPALHGVLVKIRDLGMRLISVRRLDPGEAGTTTPEGSHR
jgi:hypothetical protein